MKTSGSGKYKVTLEEKPIGEDLLLILSGGDKPHAGVVVMAEPNQETKVLVSGTHKEELVARPIAEKKSNETGKRVVCVSGVHVDNATKEEIEILVKNCKELEEQL